MTVAVRQSNYYAQDDCCGSEYARAQLRGQTICTCDYSNEFKKCKPMCQLVRTTKVYALQRSAHYKGLRATKVGRSEPTCGLCGLCGLCGAYRALVGIALERRVYALRCLMFFFLLDGGSWATLSLVTWQTRQIDRLFRDGWVRSNVLHSPFHTC